MEHIVPSATSNGALRDIPIRLSELDSNDDLGHSFPFE